MRKGAGSVCTQITQLKGMRPRRIGRITIRPMLFFLHPYRVLMTDLSE